jgi:hypothetical protein
MTGLASVVWYRAGGRRGQDLDDLGRRYVERPDEHLLSDGDAEVGDAKLHRPALRAAERSRPEPRCGRERRASRDVWLRYLRAHLLRGRLTLREHERARHRQHPAFMILLPTLESTRAVTRRQRRTSVVGRARRAVHSREVRGPWPAT